MLLSFCVHCFSAGGDTTGRGGGSKAPGPAGRAFDSQGLKMNRFGRPRASRRVITSALASGLGVIMRVLSNRPAARPREIPASPVIGQDSSRCCALGQPSCAGGRGHDLERRASCQGLLGPKALASKPACLSWPCASTRAPASASNPGPPGRGQPRGAPVPTVRHGRQAQEEPWELPAWVPSSGRPL